VTTDGVRFIAPVVYGNGLLGEEHTNTDGSFYYSGYASAKPVFGYLTQDQFYYIYNTILKLEQLQQQTKKGQAFDQFKLSYTRLAFLS